MTYSQIIGWVIILLSIAIIIASYILELGFPFASVTLILLGIIFILVGEEDAEVDCENANGKTRDEALAKSLFPGLGNIYLEEKVKGILIMGVFGFAIVMMALPFVWGEEVVVTIVYSIPLIVFSIAYSAIETTESCNKLNLPFKGGIFELNIKNTATAKSITLAMLSLCMLAIDPLMRIELQGYDYSQLLIADVCSIFILICAVYLYINQKNVNQSPIKG